MIRGIIIFQSFIVITSSLNAQFKYNEYEDIIAFSYVYPKIQEYKAIGKINTLVLPAYNNDSLYWSANPNPNRGSSYAYGFSIDTSINFFDVATRIRIDEGFIWLLKITSPTAKGLGARIKNMPTKSTEYFSIHSNLHDSIDHIYEYHLPEVELGTYIQREMSSLPLAYENGWYAFVHGNEIFLEVFSTSKRIQKSEMKLVDLIYSYTTGRPPSKTPNNSNWKDY